MDICLFLGGSEPLSGWFRALMQWKLKTKWAFAFVMEGVKAFQDAWGHLCTIKTVIWQSCSDRSKNKVPQSARLSEGGGVQSLFGQYPNRPGIFLSGASLKRTRSSYLNTVFFLPEIIFEYGAFWKKMYLKPAYQVNIQVNLNCLL